MEQLIVAAEKVMETAGRIWRVIELPIVVVCCLMGATLFYCTIVLRIYFEAQSDWYVWRAKRTEIGDGVTLFEGIRAYFGDTGYWGAGAYEYVTNIYVGEPRIVFSVVFERVSRWKRRPVVRIRNDYKASYFDDDYVSMEESEEALAILVEAVKSQGKKTKK